jgi:site-specific DNA-methyltransferase (adenine-specific)
VTQVTCESGNDFLRRLHAAGAEALDYIVLIAAALDPAERLPVLDECGRALKDGGLLFVQGTPDFLPELGVYLDHRLTFKYWIAIESEVRRRASGLPTAHAGVLLFSKGHAFPVKRTRFPHQTCTFCGRSLKDWGGKTHLMHPEGAVISDVWSELPPADNYTTLSQPALDTILRMMDFEPARGLVGPAQSVGADSIPRVPRYGKRGCVQTLNDSLVSVVHHGDALEVLKQYPDNSIDLAFSDPPYNLDKAYTAYDDERAGEEYIRWCNDWLAEYARVLKPTGSLYVLNLPRWTMYHAAFLNQNGLYFQNWIVWDAMSEPRGKLMPAHYGLLLYTKHPTDFTFNYDAVGQIDARHYCLRQSCIRQRKAAGVDDKEPLTDIWWDVHRIKHRRDRDTHPCQLPDALMERIIRLSTNPGDVVLDALAGTGTTPVTALRLGRRYVAIDLDEQYVRLMREKLAQVRENGAVARQSTRKPPRRYTKKELQLELRDLAAKLGRLPTPEDVQALSKYEVEAFFELFPTWGKALKAAKLEIRHD